MSGTETREAPLCVKPVAVVPPPSIELIMCGEPATHVGVRYDGWVSATTWCAAHVAEDDNRPELWSHRLMFTWKPIGEASGN